MAEGKIRVDYHREEGKLTFKSVTYVQEDGNLRRERSAPQLTPSEVTRLLQLQSACRDTLTEWHKRTSVELGQRRKEEDKIRGSRSMSAKRDLNTFGREDVLEPSVYDTARESAKADALREGAEEEKPEEQTSKVDILAPYLVDLVKSGTMQLDSVQATLVAKKCTQEIVLHLAFSGWLCFCWFVHVRCLFLLFFWVVDRWFSAVYDCLRSCYCHCLS